MSNIKITIEHKQPFSLNDTSVLKQVVTEESFLLMNDLGFRFYSETNRLMINVIKLRTN